MSNTAGQNVDRDASMPVSLENNLQVLNGEMAVMTGRPASSSDFLVGFAAAAAPISGVAAVALGVAAAVLGDYADSMFVSETNTKRSNAKNKPEPKPTPKPNPARQQRPGGVSIEKLNIASASVTSPIKGAEMRKAAQKFADVKRKTDITMLLMRGENRLENDANRVQDGLTKNSPLAQKAVQTNPNVAPKIPLHRKYVTGGIAT